MKRMLCITGLTALFILILGITSTNAQPRIELRVQIGNLDRSPNRYYDDQCALYNNPYSVISEMYYAGIADEDMPVILYIKANSQYSLRQIYSLRARGATWAQLSNWCGVPLSFNNHNGPPYGNAYGHYKNHRDYSDARYYDKNSRKHKHNNSKNDE